MALALGFIHQALLFLHHVAEALHHVFHVAVAFAGLLLAAGLQVLQQLVELLEHLLGHVVVAALRHFFELFHHVLEVFAGDRFALLVLCAAAGHLRRHGVRLPCACRP